MRLDEPEGPLMRGLLCRLEDLLKVGEVLLGEALASWPNVQIWAHRTDAPIIRGDSYGSFPTLTHPG